MTDKLSVSRTEIGAAQAGQELRPTAQAGQ